MDRNRWFRERRGGGDGELLIIVYNVFGSIIPFSFLPPSLSRSLFARLTEAPAGYRRKTIFISNLTIGDRRRQSLGRKPLARVSLEKNILYTFLTRFFTISVFSTSTEIEMFCLLYIVFVFFLPPIYANIIREFPSVHTTNYF